MSVSTFGLTLGVELGLLRTLFGLHGTTLSVVGPALESIQLDHGGCRRGVILTKTLPPQPGIRRPEVNFARSKPFMYRLCTGANVR